MIHGVSSRVNAPRIREPSTRTRWISVGIFAGVILLTAIVPLPDGNRPRFGPLGPDKFLHLLVHAGFTGSLAAALDDQYGVDVPLAVGIVGFSIAYGIGIEYLQESIPGRAFELADIAGDTVGSVVGVVAWRYLER